MERERYSLIENYMLSCMEDSTHGEELAGERQAAAIAFYNSLFEEVNSMYQSGKDELERLIAI